MSFERFKAQLFCESKLGCNSYDDFRNVDFENFTLDKSSAYAFKNSLMDDASSLFFKGYLSLLEGLRGFNNNSYSWSTIKCYYSVFYMLRSDMALRDYGLIRHKTIYYLKAEDGSKPITKGSRGNKRSNYSGDHKSTLNYYKDLFINSDIILSQNIDGLNPYEWLMKKREQVNYQEKNFQEPTCPDFLNYIATYVIKGKFDFLIRELLDDPYIKTFQPEFAPISIPIKRAILTRDKFLNNNLKINLTKDQLNFLNSSEYLNLINLMSIC